MTLLNNQQKKTAQKIRSLPANKSSERLQLYLRYLADILNADKVTWYAGYRGEFGRQHWHTRVLSNWKIIDTVLPVGTDYDVDAEKKAYYECAQANGGIDPQLAMLIESSGKSRVQIVDDVMTRDEWNQHWNKERLESLHSVSERMLGAYTLTSITEAFFTVDRGKNAAPFDESDKKHFLNALTDFPRLHYWLFLERGLAPPSDRPFSPREQQVIHHLLSPLSETEIAEILELSKGTVHNYITAILKNLGVNSRYQLTQLWLAPIPETML